MELEQALSVKNDESIVRKHLVMNIYLKPIFWKLSLLLIIILIPTTILTGCTNKTHIGKVGNASYSFQYRKDYLVNPPDPFNSHGELINPWSPESFIKVISVPRYAINSLSHQDKFILDTKNIKYITDFKVEKRDSVTIAGFPSEYLVYTYTGYTTHSVEYYGQLATFEYKEHFVDIHLLFPSLVGPWGDAQAAFELLVNTFQIKE